MPMDAGRVLHLLQDTGFVSQPHDWFRDHTFIMEGVGSTENRHLRGAGELTRLVKESGVYGDHTHGVVLRPKVPHESADSLADIRLGDYFKQWSTGRDYRWIGVPPSPAFRWATFEDWYVLGHVSSVDDQQVRRGLPCG